MSDIRISFIGIVNDELNADFWGTMQKLKEIGYRGIECLPAFSDSELDDVVSRLNEMDMPPFSVSVGFWDEDETIRKQLDLAKRIGAKQAVMYYAECDTMENTLEVAKKLNEIGDIFSKEGIMVCYHNHDHEFHADFDGKNALDIILENTDPDKVALQVDTGWASYAGIDAAEFVSSHSDRIFSLHLKDFAEITGSKERDGAKFAAVGSGVVPVDKIVKAAMDSGIEWASIEQDQLSVLSPMENLTFARYYIKERCGF